ncbi:hypothetical protein [Sulfitobacter pontiacus]|uniref:hypothetical protein n=1 Tax=Sulfitobacter pontiacus TaxID=60137 RepID=UPI0010FDDF48|nr:hypothetical protein [Sulfitobacter pontiacus]
MNHFSELPIVAFDQNTPTECVAFDHAGYPIPTFLSVMSDARWWASIASRDERKAYALAAFEALAISDQSAFLEYVQGSAGT